MRHVLSALYDQLAVHRKAFLVAVLVCLVALVAAYPAIESVDHWDAPGPTSDSELQYIGILTVVGAIALFTQVLALLALLLFTFETSFSENLSCTAQKVYPRLSKQQAQIFRDISYNAWF